MIASLPLVRAWGIRIARSIPEKLEVAMALAEIRDVYKVFQRDTQRIEVFTGLTLDIESGTSACALRSAWSVSRTVWTTIPPAVGRAGATGRHRASDRRRPERF